MSSIYQCLIDILAILFDFFPNRLSFDDIMSGLINTRNIDDILSIFHDILNTVLTKKKINLINFKIKKINL